MTFQIDANGPAQASDFWSDQQAVLTWNTSQFSGNDPFLGSISISLSGLAPSTGDVVPFDQANCQPDCSNCFPALNTNHLFFRFEFSNPMVPTLLSIGPIDIQGKVHDIPPVGSVFHLVNGPVPLYAEGDATQTPIAFLNSAEVHFLPSSVPTVTTWGVAVMVLLSLTAGTILIRRRPPVAQRA
jgi:hypothetical protein